MFSPSLHSLDRCEVATSHRRVLRLVQTKQGEDACGPRTAAAVILPKDFHHPVLNDSKQLTEKQRYMLRPIIEKEAVAWAVAHVSPAEIDEINILNASILGMHRSIDQLKQRPDFIAVDGNKFKPYQDIPTTVK